MVLRLLLILVVSLLATICQPSMLVFLELLPQASKLTSYLSRYLRSFEKESDAHLSFPNLVSDSLDTNFGLGIDASVTGIAAVLCLAQTG